MYYCLHASKLKEYSKSERRKKKWLRSHENGRWRGPFCFMNMYICSTFEKKIYSLRYKG